jgi:DNA-binding MarR family transcriptional regulator
VPRASKQQTARLDRFILAIDILADRLAPEGRADAPEISSREIQALRALGWAKEMRMSDLAASMRVPLSTASRVVDRLTRKRLVERAGGSDRRTVQVRFSRYGLKVGAYLMAWRRETVSTMLQTLSPGERTELLSVLDRLIAPEGVADASRSGRRRRSVARQACPE